jgi:hypothetical protein
MLDLEKIINFSALLTYQANTQAGRRVVDRRPAAPAGIFKSSSAHVAYTQRSNKTVANNAQSGSTFGTTR